MLKHGCHFKQLLINKSKSARPKYYGTVLQLTWVSRSSIHLLSKFELKIPPSFPQTTWHCKTNDVWPNYLSPKMSKNNSLPKICGSWQVLPNNSLKKQATIFVPPTSDHKYTLASSSYYYDETCIKYQCKEHKLSFFLSIYQLYFFKITTVPTYLNVGICLDGTATSLLSP